MRVTLKPSIAPLQYSASSPAAKIEVGANRHNDQDLSFRPMELILAGLASCSAIDIENILRKQRIAFSDLTIEAEGTRADTIPGVFTEITLKISIKGEVPSSKLQRAIELTKEKYCSVYHMLKDTVTIHYTYLIINSK